MSLFDPAPDYSPHDPFLFATLGVLSANQKLLAAISQAAHANESTTTDDLLDIPVHEADSELVYALLGLLALGHKLESGISTWKISDSRKNSNERQPPINGAAAIEIADLLR